MITLFFALNLAFVFDIDKSQANNLLNKNNKLSAPVEFGENFHNNPFDSSNEADKFIGRIYSELKNILSHYYVFFSENVPEFNGWYKSNDFEMDNATKKKITNILNANIKSKDDLGSFWLSTESPFLEAEIAKIKSYIYNLQDVLAVQNNITNHADDFKLVFTYPPEKRNVWLLNKAMYIVDVLASGKKNYEDNRYPDVFKDFLTAVVEKKKLDMLLANMTIHL